MGTPFTKHILTNSNWEIGDWTYGIPNVIFPNENAVLKIGKFTSIAAGVLIYLGGNHRTDWITTYPFIGNSIDGWPEGSDIEGHPSTKGNVIIGNNVTILSGVTIGDGAVIGANAVVTNNVPPYSIVVGNPATVKKYRFNREVIAQLLKIQWWNWPEDKIRENVRYLCSDQIQQFLTRNNMNLISGLKEALEIDGWMSEAELAFLAENALKATTALQIGCYKGRSSIVIGENVHSSLLDIDSFVGDYGNTLSAQDLASAYKLNVKSLLGSKIELMVGDSHEILKTLNRTFDMIFIDGSHAYVDVKKDIELSIPLLNTGGLLCGHDYSYSADVKRAVTEVFKGNAQICEGTSIWYFKDCGTSRTFLADNRIKAQAAISSGLTKLHLGCGRKMFPGYINIDLYRPEADLQLDVTDLSVFQDESIDEIYMNAVLEHLFVFEQKKALSEWRRVLKPGGILRIDSTPDFDQVIKAYGGQAKGNTRETFDIAEVIRYTHGEYGEDDKIGGVHKDLFTKDKLRKLLEREGFTVNRIESVCWGSEPHPVNINVIATREANQITSSSAKKTFGAVYCVYDDETWLRESVASVYDACNVIYFLADDQPWHGEPTDNSGTLACIGGLPDPDKKIRVVRDSWQGETNQRNAGLDILKDEGINYCFVVDADEIYDPQALRQMMLYADQHESVACWHMTWDTYWKSHEYVISPREPFKPVVFVKVGEARFDQYRSVSSDSHGFIPPEVGYCHHMSYARSDDQILQKISTFSHATEVQQDWFQNVWMKWRPYDNKINLHPTHPSAYERAVRQPLISLPPILRDYADKHPGLRPAISGLVSIIILTFNQLDYTKQCIDSIRKHTPEKHEIVFIDNNSTDGTVEWLDKIVKHNPHYRLLRNKNNLGFAKGCNQGIEAASGEYVVLLNNDVVVTKSWLAGMLECLNMSPYIGIVGPMTNKISGPQQVMKTGYASIDDLDEYAASFRSKNRHRRIPLRRIVGFCMLFRRNLVEKIGLLDENFGTGNFEDDDFCLRTSLEGHRNMIAGDVFIHHFGSRSFIGNNVPYDSTINGNKIIFNDKWRNIDTSTPLGKRLGVLNAFEKAEEYFQRQEIDRAVATIIEGIKYLPDYKEIYFRLTEILIDSERFDEALAALNSMPDDDMQEVRRIVLAGYCTYGKGLYAEALKYTEDALRLDPDSAFALNLRGRLAHKNGESEIARGYFEKAIASNLGLGISYTNLGVMRWIAKEHNEAVDLLEKGFVLSPNTSDGISLYHMAINATGEFERAETVVREAKNFHPVNKRISFLLIDLLIKQKKYKSAMNEIEKAMNLFGIDDGILAAAIQIRDQLGPVSINRSRSKGTLSVCMIVKNEEDRIGTCLASLKPVSGEIIVVDTGSSDKTKDIAYAFGAQVFDFPWTNDFSEARNFSMSKAKGDWILIHDADELISELDYDKLRSIVEQQPSQSVAFSLVTRNYSTDSIYEGWVANSGEFPSEEMGTGWFPSSKVRLIVNDERFRFENPIHELLEPSLKRAGVEIGACDVVVHHFGQANPEKAQAKAEMYYLIGKKKLETDGNTEVALRELAVQARAIRRYDESIELWKRYITINPGNYLPYFNMSGCYFEKEEFEEAFQQAKRAFELNRNSKEVVQCYTVASLFCADARDAIKSLEDLLEKIPVYPTGKMTLAAAYCVTGMKEKGIGHLKEMKEMSYDCSGMLYSLSKKFLAAGKTASAIVLLECMEESGHVHADGARLLQESCDAQAIGV